ncbi:MAG: hypothetical protein ACFUZC_19515 [Chthoniobacteraceae bacterium]
MSGFSFNMVIAALLCGVANLSAQSWYPPPKAPFVRPVPDSADWTVTVRKPKPPESSQEASAKAPSGEISQVHTVKTGDTARITVSYFEHPSDEYWISRQAVMMPNTHNTRIILMRLVDAKSGFAQYTQESSSADLSPRYFDGFTGVGWIKESYYDKVVSYDRRVCYHYVLGGKQEAWIEADTGFPVAYRDLLTGTIFLYTFASPPSAPLILPASYQEVLERYLKTEERRRQLSTSSDQPGT